MAVRCASKLAMDIFRVHRSTAMQMLSSPPIPPGHTHVDVVHPIPVATTVKVRSTAVMEQAFLSLMQFDPRLHDDIVGMEEIYRRVGSLLEIYLNLALVIAEGVSPVDYWALSFCDGMRAVNAALEFELVPGDEIIIAKPLYGCSDNYFTYQAPDQRQYVVKVVDLTEPQSIIDAIGPKTKIIFFETEANPNLRAYDLQTISRLAKEKSPHVTIIVDNTFPSPAGCNPLLLGADISVHSGTKVLGGFSQEMAGFVILPKTKWGKLFSFRKNTGGTASPHDLHNILTRGLPTLYHRFGNMQTIALAIARYLQENRYLREVIYPGLPNFTYRESAERHLIDWDGNFAPGFMIAFTPAGRTEERRVSQARKIVDFIAEFGEGVIIQAVSLGSTKSLVEMPFLGTHATVGAAEKKLWGIDGGMVRLSVGLAHPDDQIGLLRKAINHAYS